MLKKILLTVVTAVLLTGCSVNDKRETVVFSSWGSVTEVGILKELISEFERENPEIKIEFMHIPQNYFRKIHLLFASNTEPDVIFINNLNLPVYSSRLLDLSPYINRDEFYAQAIEGMSLEGKIYGFPRDISELLFYVNSDLLKSSGVEFNEGRKYTLEELTEKAAKITHGRIFGMSYEPDIYFALPYLEYFGGGILSPEGKVIADTPESLAGIEFYKNLNGKYKAAPKKSEVGSSTLAEMFIEGRIGFYLSGRWMYPKINESAGFNWYVVRFPLGKNPYPCDVSGWAVSKNSRHRESALKLARYLSSYEGIKKFTMTGLIVPSRSECAKFMRNGTHNEREFTDIIKDSANTPVSKDYKRLTDDLNRIYEF